MVGKGSVSHNSRQFNAKNTDPARTHLNKAYVNEDIRAVYHELFDEAVKRYNEKQTRSDRCITDYYEKIRSSKQEKPFHELIIQIGNKDDCGVDTTEGEKATRILDEYMQGFQSRNPSLKVFSAHMHMDEATPHLHIDFVPYTTGSKRGLDTRISLKQALAALGFKGGTRGDTEWNQWVAAEKRCLAAIMREHGIEWEQKGTHEEHLSVLAYKKQERAKEVEELSHQAEALEKKNAILASSNDQLVRDIVLAHNDVKAQQAERDKVLAEAEEAKRQAEENRDKLTQLTTAVKDIESFAEKYTQEPEVILPKPDFLESGASYREHKAKPVIKKMNKILRTLYAKFRDLTHKYAVLEKLYNRAVSELENLKERFGQLHRENTRLRCVENDYHRARSILGGDTVDRAILTSMRMEEEAEQLKRQKAAIRHRKQPSL